MRSASEEPATVNAIVHDLGIDQSGASQLIKSATATGHLVIAASPADGRRRETSLAPAGRSMLDQAHRWQEDIFAQLTTGWSDKKRHDFQLAMSDLMDRSYAMDAGAMPTRYRASKDGAGWPSAARRAPLRPWPPRCVFDTRVREVGEPVAALRRRRTARPFLEPAPKSGRNTCVGDQQDRVLATRAQVVGSTHHR